MANGTRPDDIKKLAEWIGEPILMSMSRRSMSRRAACTPSV